MYIYIKVFLSKIPNVFNCICFTEWCFYKNFIFQQMKVEKTYLIDFF